MEVWWEQRCGNRKPAIALLGHAAVLSGDSDFPGPVYLMPQMAVRSAPQGTSVVPHESLSPGRSACLGSQV